MRIVAGILLLTVGAVFPLGMLAWLNHRFSHQPRPTPHEVGLLLAFNGFLPVGLVTLGLGLMMPQLWEKAWLRVAALSAWLGVGVVLVVWVAAGWVGPAGGRNGR